MYPSDGFVDRTLPPECAVRDALQDADLDVFDGEERLARLHRILYPVCRVTSSYRPDNGLFGSGPEEATAFVDGLWSGNDPSLVRYRDGATDPERISLADEDPGADHLVEAAGETLSSPATWDESGRYAESEETADLRYFG